MYGETKGEHGRREKTALATACCPVTARRLVPSSGVTSTADVMAGAGRSSSSESGLLNADFALALEDLSFDDLQNGTAERK
jgi:hypothetical protein